METYVQKHVSFEISVGGVRLTAQFADIRTFMGVRPEYQQIISGIYDRFTNF